MNLDEAMLQAEIWRSRREQSDKDRARGEAWGEYCVVQERYWAGRVARVREEERLALSLHLPDVILDAEDLIILLFPQHARG